MIRSLYQYLTGEQVKDTDYSVEDWLVDFAGLALFIFCFTHWLDFIVGYV